MPLPPLTYERECKSKSMCHLYLLCSSYYCCLPAVLGCSAMSNMKSRKMFHPIIYLTCFHLEEKEEVWMTSVALLWFRVPTSNIAYSSSII